jgi:hypothetical protein
VIVCAVGAYRMLPPVHGVYRTTHRQQQVKLPKMIVRIILKMIMMVVMIAMMAVVIIIAMVIITTIK